MASSREILAFTADASQELIKYKGLQVAPAELEEVLLTNPKIADAAVIGVDGDGTEVPRSVIVHLQVPATRLEKLAWSRAMCFKILRHIVSATSMFSYSGFAVKC